MTHVLTRHVRTLADARLHAWFLSVTRPWMDLLPQSVATYCLTFLPTASLLSAKCVSRTFHCMCSDPRAMPWANVCHFPILHVEITHLLQTYLVRKLHLIEFGGFCELIHFYPELRMPRLEEIHVDRFSYSRAEVVAGFIAWVAFHPAFTVVVIPMDYMGREAAKGFGHLVQFTSDYYTIDSANSRVESAVQANVFYRSDVQDVVNSLPPRIHTLEVLDRRNRDLALPATIRNLIVGGSGRFHMDSQRVLDTLTPCSSGSIHLAYELGARRVYVTRKIGPPPSKRQVPHVECLSCLEWTDDTPGLVRAFPRLTQLLVPNLTGGTHSCPHVTDVTILSTGCCMDPLSVRRAVRFPHLKTLCIESLETTFSIPSRSNPFRRFFRSPSHPISHTE